MPRYYESEDVPEGLDYLWQVLDQGGSAFAQLVSLPHAASAASKIEQLTLNELRAIALARVRHNVAAIQGDDGALEWEHADRIDLRGWLDSE